MESSSKAPVTNEKSNDFNNSSNEEDMAVATTRLVVSGDLQRGLKPRHAQMIALGGTIGTGLFVGSAAALATGGPAFLLAAYIAISIMVYFVVSAVIEVAAYLPVRGGTMAYYGDRYVSKSLGFSLGWLYFYSLGILVPYEITAAAVVIEYWGSSVNVAVWITIFIVVIFLINFMPVQFYGETEFWFASIKIFAIIGLLILSFILFWGGGPSRDRLGFRYWKNPGATNTLLLGGDTGRFIAFLQSIILSTFAFLFAPELLVTTAGEMKAPRQNLPKAASRLFWRLVIFYVGSVLAIGIICPFNDKRLGSGVGAKASAFVVGILNAGISDVLASIINAVIITSAWSSGNSFAYVSSRSLYSMAIAGNAPAIFKKCTKQGVPYMAVGATMLFSPLAYLNCANASSQVFSWFVSITNTSGYISWICCCIIYIRFRKACQATGVSKSELPFQSSLQPYGAWIAIVFFAIMMLVNGFTVFFPSQWKVSTFLTAYIGIPAFLIIYLGHKIFRRSDPWLRPVPEIDITTNLDEILSEEPPVEEGPRTWKQKLHGILT